MKGLKNVLIFCAGSVTTLMLISYSMLRDSEYPREGTIEYEDERIKVSRWNAEPVDKVGLAVITYKKTSEEEKTEE